jgi:hypothetical protein
VKDELAAANSEAHKFIFSQESILDKLFELDIKIDSYKKHLVHYFIEAEKKECFLE